MQTHVIIGAGMAGAKAAQTLREEGYEGRVVMVGSEPARPYERPPLSKDLLRGEAEEDDASVHAAGFYEEHDIELRTETTATGIDLGTGEVELEGGERLGYDRLLLTPGAEPRRLPVPGDDLDGVHYLRDLRDCAALRARLEAGGHAVVVGAGWIGAEVAASARTKGLDVTLLEQQDVPLQGALGRELGEIYAEIHRDHGVALETGAEVEAFEGEGRVERVRLAGGRTIDCAFAVVGVGVAPRTELAERAGLACENGIQVDERLRASAGEAVYAAGDAANAVHPFYGRRLRVEHWHNALEQGPAAARGMLGRGEPYERIPYFFSDQYDVGMEYVGFATEWEEVVFRGDVAAREFIAFWLQGGRVLAGMNVNVWDVSDAISELIRSRSLVDVAELRDPDVAVGDLASR